MCCGVSIGALPLDGGGGGPYEECRFSALPRCIETELEWYDLLGSRFSSPKIMWWCCCCIIVGMCGW